MSAIQNKQAVWPPMAGEGLAPLSSKYEKCRHIAEEIYKRIDITFQIKSLEAGSQSDISDQSDQIEIDSNDLSNGTDLFAYDKSDSIPSSTEQDDKKQHKLINLNNNEIKKSVVPIYKPPRKRFRKKVKKRQSKGRSDSEGSSDEAPLSRMADAPPARAPAVAGPGVASPAVGAPSDESDRAMGVPDLSAVTAGREPRLKLKPTEKEKPATKPKAPETITRFEDTTSPTKLSNPMETEIKPLDLASESRAVEKPVNFTKPYLPECRVNIEVFKPIDFSAAKVGKDNRSTVKSKAAKESKAEKSKAEIAKGLDKTKTQLTNQNKSDTKKNDAKITETTDAVEKNSKKETKDGEKEKGGDWRKCSMCNLPCRGERGLRRHMSLSHILVPEDVVRPKTRKSHEEKSV
ncbi:neurofilament medium polypeptide [Plutella xylostella]|uniref:neurofilament medium polypeptide n=1 Tax=Plutella xylostella TaxID=51655 RepID=UPI0020322A23|nr:neurofilament medium polypeptide [Plutella xylostella]